MSNDHIQGGMEDREVKVADPDLSDSLNRHLTEEVREVVGADEARIPRARSHPSRGERPASSGLLTLWSTNKFIVLVVFMAFVVIGAIVSLTSGSWWFFVLAVFVDAVGTFVVAGLVLSMTANVERPEPSTVAMLEEEGVRNPEQHFSQVVAEFTQEHRSDQSESDRRSAAVEDNPLKAASEQGSAQTATGGQSEPVGPGTDDQRV